VRARPEGIDLAVLALLQQHLDAFGPDHAGSFVAAVPEPSILILIPLVTPLAISRQRRVSSK